MRGNIHVRINNNNDSEDKKWRRYLKFEFYVNRDAREKRGVAYSHLRLKAFFTSIYIHERLWIRETNHINRYLTRQKKISDRGWNVSVGFLFFLRRYYRENYEIFISGDCWDSWISHTRLDASRVLPMTDDSTAAVRSIRYNVIKPSLDNVYHLTFYRA